MARNTLTAIYDMANYLLPDDFYIFVLLIGAIAIMLNIIHNLRKL